MNLSHTRGHGLCSPTYDSLYCLSSTSCPHLLPGQGTLYSADVEGLGQFPGLTGSNQPGSTEEGVVLGSKELAQAQRGHLEATQGIGHARRAGACPRGGGQKRHSGGHVGFKSGVINARSPGGQAGKQTRQVLVFGKR